MENERRPDLVSGTLQARDIECPAKHTPQDTSNRDGSAACPSADVCKGSVRLAEAVRLGIDRLLWSAFNKGKGEQ